MEFKFPSSSKVDERELRSQRTLNSFQNLSRTQTTALRTPSQHSPTTWTQDASGSRAIMGDIGGWLESENIVSALQFSGQSSFLLTYKHYLFQWKQLSEFHLTSDINSHSSCSSVGMLTSYFLCGCFNTLVCKINVVFAISRHLDNTVQINVDLLPTDTELLIYAIGRLVEPDI